MKERMIFSTCPNCGHVFQIKRDTVVIAGMNSVVDKRLNDGTYFMHDCQQCHHLYYLTQPFLYRDPDKKYILLLSNQEHISNLPKDETVIRCKSVPQFLFSYKVMSQQLNIHIVYQKKKALENRLEQKVKFDSYDEKNQCLWFYVKNDLKAVVLSSQERKKIKNSV